MVKSALSSVPGVQQVDVSFAEKKAVVVFGDGGAVDVAALIAATTDAGYPAEILQK